MVKLHMNIILCFALIFMITMFSSCSIIEAVISDLKSEPKKSPKEQAETILAYLEVGDIEGIREMFCERLRNQENIDEKIQEAIDLLDGKILSYTAKGAEGGASWSQEGNIVSAWGHCRDIKMSDEKIYFLNILLYKENDFEPDLEGITFIAIREIYEELDEWTELIRIEV